MECKYRCNCINNVQCDNVTGSCPYGCQRGWMGPACQYRNLAALEKGHTVKQHPPGADGINAIDFKLTTCSTTGQGIGRRWLQIDLREHYNLVGFVIWIKANQLDRFRRFTIKIGNNTNMDTWNLCYEHVSDEDGKTILEVVCTEPLIGQYVLISLADNETRDLSLCEVEIFGGRLVSFQKPALMDSVYVDNGTWDSSYAVDGKVMLHISENQAWKNVRTCASTEFNETVKRDRWWSVDLETAYNIRAFSLYGRKEWTLDWQIRDFAVEGSEDNNTYSQLFKDPLNSSKVENYQPMSGHFLKPRRARFLKVIRQTVVLLCLCEMEIFAECPHGFCGWECNKTCMCSSQTTGTHKILGTCPYGCVDRWTGVNQMCDKKCDEYHWGKACEKRCGNCTVSCSVLNGTCPGSCKAGFVQPYCAEACPGGTYGQDCMSKCGSCQDAALCDNVDGRCLAGCQSGYNPPLCNETCSAGLYGPNCLNKCGYCRNEETCNFVNGTCLSGCVVGYQAPLCQTTSREQKKASSSSNVAIVGGISGAVAVVIIVGAGAVVAIVFLRKRRSLRSELKERTENKEFTEPVVFSNPDDDEVIIIQEQRKQKQNCQSTGTYENPDVNFIDVCKLRSLCSNIVKDPSEVFADFNKLPFGPLRDNSTARHSQYRSLNKYREMYPYNDNRVVLPEIRGNLISTYINASYINGYNQKKKYIAAQGALKTTVDDVWRMVWSEDVTVIAMLSDYIEEGKVKCTQYWPDEGSNLHQGINVQLMSTEEYADFKIRTFYVSKKNVKAKTVVQFHFTAWPDKDVPDTALSIVQFWRKVREYVPSNKKTKMSPWLVHCSAGVGRTGTFIATDCLYDQGKEEDRVDIKGCVFDLRNQRLKMVQTKEQYLLLHEVVTEILDPIGTVCSDDDFLIIYPSIVSGQSKNKQKLYVEYQEICRYTTEFIDEAGVYLNTTDKHVRDAEKPENFHKSRCSSIIPEDKDRPRLTTVVQGCNDFINAVYIPTYRYRDRMLLTQYPLRETAVDFLRMLWEVNITAIVLLESYGPEEGRYWPKAGNLMTVGPFKVKTKNEKSQEMFIFRTLLLKMTCSRQRKEVLQYHFQQWPEGKNIPDNVGSILQLIRAVENNRDNNEKRPIVIQCLDGCQRSGVFCLIYSVLERVKLDRQVAVAETLRLARVKRRQIINNYEQYQYCYDVVYEYLRSFDVYANIT